MAAGTENLTGRDVRELDTGRYGIIAAAEPGDGWHRAFCVVDFEDGTRGERMPLGPYGKGDLCLADRSEEARALYDTDAYLARLLAYRAGAALRMAEGLAATLAGIPLDSSQGMP